MQFRLNMSFVWFFVLLLVLLIPSFVNAQASASASTSGASASASAMSAVPQLLAVPQLQQATVLVPNAAIGYQAAGCGGGGLLVGSSFRQRTTIIVPRQRGSVTTFSRTRFR